MTRRKITLVKPEIARIITWTGEKWVGADGKEATIDPVREFEIADETKPDLVHYICKYGYRISEEDGQMKVLRIGFIEYGKESTDNMA